MTASRVALTVTLGLTLLAAPLAASAQPSGKVWRVGLLHVGLDHVPTGLSGLRDGLKALGYEVGRNIQLDFRNVADEGAARATADEFVRQRVDLIVAFEVQTVRAAKAATAEIPIVMVSPGDPVANGFINSLAKPGGNVTGLASLTGTFSSKQIEVFKEMVPALQRLLVLSDPQDPSKTRELAEIRIATTKLGIRLVEREASDRAAIERAFASLDRRDGAGVFVAPGNLRTKFRGLVMRLASEHRLPMASHRKDWTEGGALFSYGQNLAAEGADAARYVDKILKGAKPANLPVEQPTKFELVINLKTAKALGLTIPQSLLQRADEIIQ